MQLHEANGEHPVQSLFGEVDRDEVLIYMVSSQLSSVQHGFAESKTTMHANKRYKYFTL